jgi:hypothetical protein
VDEANHTVICHERLAIVGTVFFSAAGENNSSLMVICIFFSKDVEHGAQPLTNEHDTLWLSVNGEIYNRKAVLILRLSE